MSNTIPETPSALLTSLYGHDFSDLTQGEALLDAFFAKPLSIAELNIIHNFIAAQSSYGVNGVITIAGTEPGDPFAIMTQLHGNEPAGHAGILLAMALASADLLTRSVVGIIGNTLAAKQYFEAYANAPTAPQETRDCFRRGLGENGELLDDMNRTRVDFRECAPDTHHIKRAQDIWHVAQHICGIADIHTARGNMVCYTDHKRDADLQDSPVRAILTDLATAIGSHASGAGPQVKTFKTLLAPLPNIECQIGIEAGRHEDPACPTVAASFIASLLHALGFSKAGPHYKQEDGIFERYSVQPKLSYADLIIDGTLQDGDIISMARETKDGIEEYQYDEMQAVQKDQVIAIAKPSGTKLRAPSDFSGIFWSKNKTLYDKDPAVGPWPIKRSEMTDVKFCYPCKVSKMKVEF